jgi:hypothetical protein
MFICYPQNNEKTVVVELNNNKITLLKGHTYSAEIADKFPQHFTIKMLLTEEPSMVEGYKLND